MVLYWNKELFKEAGLDPNKPPTSWAELKDMATKLTKKDATGKVTQYGVQIPSSGFPYWLFQTLSTTNDAILANEAGTAVKFDDPKVIEALQYWVDLGKAGVHPPRRGGVGHDAEGLLREEGGDDLHHHRQPDQRPQQRQVRLRRGHDPGQQAQGLAHRRRQLLHLQEVQRRRSRKRPSSSSSGSRSPSAPRSGASTPATWRCRRPPTTPPALKKYGAEFPPALVARDQLPFSVAEFSTHDNQRVTKALNDGLQAALTGTKTPGAGDAGRAARGRPPAAQLQVSATPCAARPAPRLRMARSHAWLLLLPALLLLVGFTHYPTVATLIDSFFSTPKGSRPACGWGWRTTR